MKPILIFIDDERKIESVFNNIDCCSITARDYNSAINVINYYSNCPIMISFDHDLGETKTGYDICKYIVENEIPITYYIHSMNVVGAMNMEQLLHHYGYERFM